MAVLFLGLRHAAFQWRGKRLQVRQAPIAAYVRKGEGRRQGADADVDRIVDIIKVSGGSVNMYGQPGKTVITFTADGKSYDVAWVLGSDKLNVKDVLPTGADYAWKAKVVGTDTALNNEDNGGTLLDHDRYKAPTPKPEPSEPSEPSKPSEPSDSDASTEGEAATRNDRPVASSRRPVHRRRRIQALDPRPRPTTPRW